MRRFFRLANVLFPDSWSLDRKRTSCHGISTRIGALAAGPLLFLIFILAACLPAGTSPAPTLPPVTAPPLPAEPPAWHLLDDTWGPYLAEREWGNPREAVRSGDGWSFTYEKALSTPYRFGEDGIAGITDRALSVAFAFAFFQPGQPYLTERLYGLDNPSGRYGETILEDRVFYENTPTHSYMRYGYNYPFQADFAQAVMEYAKWDSRTMVAQVTLTGLVKARDAPLHLVPQVWFHTNGQVNRTDEQTWDAVYPGGHFVVVADHVPDSWQVTLNQHPIRAAINAALVNQGTLADSGEGNKAAWDFVLELAPGQTQVLRFGIAQAIDFSIPDCCRERAGRGR
ncbi:MAG: hypothetical protein P8186_01385 [Anaerolineae bacterium]